MKETKSYCVTSFGDYAEGLGTLRASGGDIGGGSEMLVLQRRFSNVIVQYTDISPTIEAGGGEGGNNLPMIVADYISDDPTPKVGGALPLPSKQNGGDA